MHEAAMKNGGSFNLVRLNFCFLFEETSIFEKFKRWFNCTNDKLTLPGEKESFSMISSFKKPYFSEMFGRPFKLHAEGKQEDSLEIALWVTI